MSVTGSIMAGAGLAGAGISAFGANKAADTQANSAQAAINAQTQASNNALNFEKQQYGNSLQMLNPYLQTGYGALGMLRNGLGIGGPMPQGFSLDSSTTNQPQIPGGLLNFLRNGGDPSSLPGIGNRPSAGGPQLMSANSATMPASGGGSAVMPNNPSNMPSGFGNKINGISPINGGTAQLPPGGFAGGQNFSGGPQASGTPGGIVGNNPNPDTSGIIQANGGGSAQVGNVDPNAGAGGSGMGFGSLLQGYGPFTAPTGVTEQNDPGYMFRLNTGLDQMTNSAAARGGLLSGGTEKAMQDFAQQDASNEYGNVYNRAQNTYGTNYNTFTNNQTNQFNKLAAISGLGQTSANQLSTAGLNTANQVGSNLLGTAGAIGGDLQNAGNARATGLQNVSNTIGNSVSGLGNLALLSQILGQGGGGGFPGGIGDPSVGGFCWIAEELYGVDAPKTHAIRGWLKNEYSQTPIGKKFTDWYLANGERVAEKIKKDQPLREKFQRLFDMFASYAMPEPVEDFESMRYQR